MQITFKAFKEKIEQINEIDIRENYSGIKYSVNTNNEELKKYIENILNEIYIIDTYEIDGWIYEQKHFDEVIDTIKNMESYNDLEKLYQNPIIDKDRCRIIHYSNKNISAFKLEFNTEGLKQFMLNEIKDIDNITIKKEKKYAIYIQHDIIAMKEECKYDCRTNIRKHEIEQIFNLGD